MFTDSDNLDIIKSTLFFIALLQFTMWVENGGCKKWYDNLLIWLTWANIGLSYFARMF